MTFSACIGSTEFILFIKNILQDATWMWWHWNRSAMSGWLCATEGALTVERLTLQKLRKTIYSLNRRIQFKLSDKMWFNNCTMYVHEYELVDGMPNLILSSLQTLLNCPFFYFIRFVYDSFFVLNLCCFRFCKRVIKMDATKITVHSCYFRHMIGMSTFSLASTLLFDWIRMIKVNVFVIFVAF